jgi:aminoglycoside phosphotransferase (APT) family kinase protein
MMTRTIDDQLLQRALRAAGVIAERVGSGSVEPVFLHRSQHISVLLPSMATVVRMRVDSGGDTAEGLRRELAVTRYLAEKQAPIVAPSTGYSAGPHFHDGFAMTLWPYVEHDVFDDENGAHIASAAKALRAVHAALADYPHTLPGYRTKIDACGALLADGAKLPGLAKADRTILLNVYTRLADALASFSIEAAPIHGDCQTGNVFMTAAGARWTDFESASLGPREWDILWMHDPTAFEPYDRNLFGVLLDLRSVCVSVWCWALAHIPEKREAAEVHLDYLKTRYAPSHRRV